LVPDPENRLGIVADGTGGLGAAIARDGCPDVFVSQKLANDLVLAGVPIEKNLADSVPESVRRHGETATGED
jgi:hypothetical protein